MTSRLLALFLAFWVGIPICCCDVLALHATKQVAETVNEHACCHAEMEFADIPTDTSVPDNQNSQKGHDCLCQVKGASTGLVEQDVLPVPSSTQVSYPQPAEYVLALCEWQLGLISKPPVKPPCWHGDSSQFSNYTGRQFCERDCRWLL